MKRERDVCKKKITGKGVKEVPVIGVPEETHRRHVIAVGEGRMVGVRTQTYLTPELRF